MREYGAYRGLFADRERPLAFCDRDALDRNVRTVQDRPGETRR